MKAAWFFARRSLKVLQFLSEVLEKYSLRIPNFMKKLEIIDFCLGGS